MSADLKQPLSRGTESSHARLSRHDLEDLPVALEHRKFADAAFCLLFSLFCAGMVVLAIYSVASTGGVNGYERLTNGVQFDGEICGVDLPKQPYLYWPSPDVNFGVCVSRCPVSTSAEVCAKTDSKDVCWEPYDTHAVYHYCIPSSSGNQTAVKDYLSHTAFGRMVADLRRAWPVLIGSAIVAMVSGFIYLSMLWYFGPCLVYGCIIVLIVALALGGYALLDHASVVTPGAQHDGLVAAAVVTWLIDLAFILLVCVMRKSLRVALTCLKQAALAIGDMKRILLLPVAKFGILLVIMIWFVIVAVFIVCSGTFTLGSITVPGYDLTVTYQKVVWTDSLRYSLLYHSFGTVWSLAFVMATADVIIAGAVAHWYFTAPQGGERRVESPVSRSVAIALKRQSGAIAFGSLVLTLVWFIKWALRYLAKRLKQTTGDNRLVKFLVCCCMCCVSCFECCIKFMERQAYIEMAIFGGGFCTSAKRAYHLVARNALRLVAVNSLGSVFSILGVLIVVATSCLATYFITVSAYTGPTGVSSPLLIVFVAFIISFVIGSVFMQVLDMSIQTMLHCFIADEEAHDGQPMYLPNSTEFSRALHKADHVPTNDDPAPL